MPGPPMNTAFKPHQVERLEHDLGTEFSGFLSATLTSAIIFAGPLLTTVECEPA